MIKYIKDTWNWFANYEKSPNFEVKIIADSISGAGTRLTTFQLKYPRFIHGELMTHRDFSRNASSSRAIPVQKMIAQVWHNPAMPVHWGANQPGMKARQELEGRKARAAKSLWRTAAKVACVVAWGMTKVGLHKQVANRILEPWQHMHTIVSATEFENFFTLRCHPDAQPEFQELARMMRMSYLVSVPRPTSGWHLPYVTDAELEELQLEKLIAISVARCARVSYLTHDKKAPDVEKDIALHDALVSSVPIHASPAEHQAWPSGDPDTKFANFREWIQYRADIELRVLSGEINAKK